MLVGPPSSKVSLGVSSEPREAQGQTFACFVSWLSFRHYSCPIYILRNNEHISYIYTYTPYIYIYVT